MTSIYKAGIPEEERRQHPEFGQLPAVADMWLPMYSVQQLWGAQVIAFDCLCGEKDIILSEPGVPKTCRCGREYRSKLEVQVRGPW